MRTWVAVAIGGALGSVARHVVNHIVHTKWLTTAFPAGTLAVNVIGCVVIGSLAGLLASGRIALREEWRAFVFVGVLGGFTTFSTFGLDTFTLARSQPSQAALNVTLQLVGGMAGVWVGYRAGLSL